MTEWLRKITKSDIRNILAIITVLGVFVLLVLMLFKEIPATNKDPFTQSVGFVLGGFLGGVCGFYFGASKNETDRTKKEKEEE